MTVLYCTEGDLADYILQAYLDKINEINPGVVARMLAGVSAEIREVCMSGGYDAGVDGVESALLKRICAVCTAYRCVGDITTLMDTEASSGNEWIPLQKQFDCAQKELSQIREGKLDPWPCEAEDAGISVAAPMPIFGKQMWEKF